MKRPKAKGKRKTTYDDVWLWLVGVCLAVGAFYLGKSSSNGGDSLSENDTRMSPEFSKPDNNRVDYSAPLSESRTDPVSLKIQEQLKSTRSALERQARKQLEEQARLIQSGEIIDYAKSERVLRQVMAQVPWMVEPYVFLAKFMTEEPVKDENYHVSKDPNTNRPPQDVHQVFALLRTAMRLHHVLPEAKPDYTPESLLKSLEKFPAFSKPFSGPTYSTRLRHDRDQLVFLGQQGKLPVDLAKQYIDMYDALLAQIPSTSIDKPINIKTDMWATSLGGIWNRALYIPEIAPLQGPVLNPNLDFAALEQTYLSSTPNFVVVDDLLSQEALQALRLYYQEATIYWNDYPGYVGSHLFDGGLGNPVLAQMVDELKTKFPRLICSHRLTQAWAYKYDSGVKQPTNAHADMAAINFNLWLDDGNVDKHQVENQSGGLTVFNVVPPSDWPFKYFNRNPLHPEAEELLKKSNYANQTIGHRANRVVIFQSDLFHQGGDMSGGWSLDYKRRRINLTLLFGQMRAKCAT